MPSWSIAACGQAGIIYGSAAITAGTAMPTHGLRADGKSRPARMRYGWRRATSIGTGDMCSWRGAGGKRENAVNGQPCRGLPVAVVEMAMLAHINPLLAAHRRDTDLLAGPAPTRSCARSATE